MKSLRYGNLGQVSFDSWNEYYYTLGFLANGKNAEIHWEHNEDSGAWGSEGRIYCKVPEARFPQCFKFTAGNGSAYARINCNGYVASLVTDHYFSENGSYHNLQKIVETVPDKYLSDFQKGYGGSIPQKRVQKKIDYPERVMPKVKVGDFVTHKNGESGKVTELSEKYISIDFGGKIRKFQFPNAIEQGFIILK